MGDYAAPAAYPYKDRGETGALPLVSMDYNDVVEALVDLAGAGGRVADLETSVAAIDLGLATVLDAGTSLWARGKAEPYPRFAGAGDTAADTGVLWISFFYAPIAVTLDKLGMVAGVVAGAGRTLARAALFAAGDDNALTLLARTANTSIFGAGAYGSTSAALATAGGYPASYDLVAGSRYAFAFLQVGGTICSLRTCSVLAADIPPIMSARVSGQTDIAAAYASGVVDAGVHYEVAYLYGEHS